MVAEKTHSFYKKRWIYLILSLWLLGGIQHQTSAQDLTYKEAREILFQAENTASEFENLLNAISNTNSGREEISLFCNGSYSPGPNQIFVDKNVVIEDNLNPEHITGGQAQDKSIAAYLSDFDISYNKTDDPSVRFDKRKMGPIRRTDFLFVNFLYENVFNSTPKGMELRFVPTQRILTIRAEKQGNKWHTYIAGGRFAVATDSLATPPADVVAIQKSPEQAAKGGADDGKDVFAEIMQAEARREYAERRTDREKAYGEAMKEGDDLLAKEQYDQAVEAFERAIAINSYDYKARARLQEVVRVREHIRALEAKKSQDLQDLLEEGTRVQDYGAAKSAAEQLLRRTPGNTALQDQLRTLEVRLNELDQSRAAARQLDASGAVKFWDKEVSKAEKAKDSPTRLADLQVERALAYFQKNDFKHAFADLTDALKANSNHRPALLALAQVHIKNNEPYKAMNDFTLIITNSKFSPGYYRERALVKLQIKDTAGALADFNQAIGLDAAEPDLFYGRSQIFMMRHAYEEAIQDLAKAQDLDPKASRYPYQRGLAFLGMGEIEKASKQFAIARKNNASSDELRAMAAQAWAKFEIGQTLARLGQLQQALTTLNDALSLNPELVEAALEKGKVLMKMLDYASAETSLSEALEVRKTYNPVRVARSTTRLALKNTEGALQDCMTALQFEAQNYLALIALAEVYMAQDRMPDALVQYKKAESLYPEQPAAFLSHGRALSRAGQPDKADDFLEKALKYSKDTPAEPLLAQAENALRKHDYKETQKLAEKSLKSGLILADAILIKGYAIALAGDAKGGLSQILGVADKDPDQYYPQALIMGAETYLLMGQSNRAHQLLDKMLPARRTLLAAQFYTALGNTRFAADSIAEAKQAYTAAQTADDTYAPAKYGLARCAARAKDVDLALRLLKESLATKPMPKESVQGDPAFAGIKEDKRFRSILRDVY